VRARKRILNRAKRVGPEEAAELREQAREVTGPEGEVLPPIVTFEALFVADTYEKAALIAPQLAFHEVQEMQLLGPSGWNHPDLLSIGGRHVEGAVFTETFFAESRFAFVAEFSDRYRATFGAHPDVLAAQAFDAANLALVQLAKGLTSRTEMREGLLTVRAYPGVSGITTIRADGNARKRPFVLGVRGGHIVSLD
jgi:ABC-type branched-subunit amino acid transport system substrate-binding protein